MSTTALTPPSYADVQAAAQRLDGIAQRTPVLRSRSADALLGAQVFFKCENRQRTGSFKFRGAYNALARFTPAQREKGVLTYSTGNHAQAIALAARLLDMPAVVVVSENAPAAKIAATRDYGAQVVTYNPLTENRETISVLLAQQRGMTLIPPADHADVIAGNGTVAQELFEEVPNLDYLFVCLGSGSLLAGSLLTAQAVAPGCRVLGVEPETSNAGQQSLRNGKLAHIPLSQTIADAAQTTSLASLAFALIQPGVEEILTVSDEQLVRALRFFAERMKMVVEPTGALAYAGAVHGGVPIAGSRVGVIVSGGNVDLQRYARFLA